MLGSLISSHYAWQISFIIMASYTAVIFFLCYFFLEETHTPQHIPLKIRHIFTYYTTITRHPLFLGYVLCSLFMVAGESAFNTASSFLLIQTYGITKNTFGMLITCLAVGHLVGTLICGRLVKHYDLANMMGIGVIILAFSTTIMALAINLGYTSVPIIIMPMILYYIGTGFVMTITAVGAVTPFPHLIGISSSAALSLNFGFSALSSALMSHLSTRTAGPVSLLIASCGIAAFFSWYWLIVPNRSSKTAALEAV
jgi:predicted MFS family arabinose efflux permease